MGNRYIVSRTNVTPVAGQDIISAISAANRRIRLVRVTVSGRGTSSAAQQLHAGRSTGGTTPGGGITPNKYDHTEQPAAVFTTATTWAAQPTFETNSEPLGFNALGGYLINNFPKDAIEARNGENISIRCPTGATTPQAIDISIVVEED